MYQALRKYVRIGIKNIELGSKHAPVPDFKLLFAYKKEYDANFIVKIWV
jgi:hypothetical protein